MRSVELNQVAGDYAAKLGLREPTIKSARFSSWAPTGLRPRLSRRWPTLIVDSRFDELDPAEQEAAIASALLSAAASPRYWRHMALAGCTILVTAFVIGGVATLLPAWSVSMAPLLSGACGLLATSFVHRRFVYAVDRATVEAFGWTVIDTSLELHRRLPLKSLHPNRLYTPNTKQRMARLDRLREPGALTIPTASI